MGAAQRRFYLMIFLLVFGVISDAKAAAAPTDNAEIKQIFDADQKDREAPPGQELDWKTIGPRDAARRKRVRELIDQGNVSTGKDYERAALVFQHWESSDDILLAHIPALPRLERVTRMRVG
jgi:hypothetical protein